MPQAFGHGVEVEMVKNGLMVLILAALVAGKCFSQTDFATMPKNTIALDFGPTIIGALLGGTGSMAGDQGLSTAGFGIAAHYERQIRERLSVAGRCAYLGYGMEISMENNGDTAVSKTDMYAFSLEGHIRYFPWGKAFFLDGMLGYANMSAAFSGEVIATDEYGVDAKESISVTASRNYFKLGAKLGWRIDFGNPGGFTFEPSFGYYGGIGVSDTIGKQLTNEVAGDVESLDEMFSTLENVIFIGGPRLALSFGWRF
jgi:hypothetical protein